MGLLQLVCTAPLEWNAGYDYLLVALRRLIDADVEIHLTIAADGPADQHVRYDIADMALGAAVTRMPMGSPTALVAADVFVLTAVRGDHTYLVREAMTARLPVVAFDAPELVPLVDPAVGALVPRRDTDTLIQVIAGLAADPAACSAMGNSSYRRVSSTSTSM